MDQNSSNDAEKRNWRERLGIGTKDMPKISGEFSRPAEPVLVMPAKGEGKSDPGQPVVVAKPAPMAPRVAARPAPARSAPAAERPARPPQASTAPAARPMQPASPQSPDVLAERLRNQREAAEKLAEQRVNNAKERAEANKAAQAQAQSQVQPQLLSPGAGSQQPPQGAQRPRPERGGGKPKFTFAEEEVRADAKRDPRPMPQVRPAGAAPSPPSRGPGAPPPLQPQIAPARPPLGGQGDRFVAPQVPPPSRPVAQPPGAGAGSGFPPPPYRPQPPGAGYRPIDPATGYTPPPAFQMPRGTMAPPPGPRPAAMPGGMGGDPRLQTGPYITDQYPPSLPTQGGIPRYEQLNRGAPPPLRNDQLRPQTHSYDGDIHDDIFEDGPAKPVRRASSSDYSQAYHPEAEMDYAPQRRRSGGPLLLLLLLGVAAAVGIGGVLYYQNMLKTGASASNDQAPVVAAPGGDVKTAAPDATTAPAAGQSTAQPSKKQIYDRIVGDREILGGQMMPTEEPPVQPAIDPQTQPAAVAPPPGAAPDEPLPLPMPPPVNTNTQGDAGGQALPVPAAPAATAAAEPVPLPAPSGSEAQVTATGYSSEQQQQMAAASQQQTLIEDAPPPPPVETAAPEEAAPPPAAKPAKAKPAAKAKPKKKVETAAKDLGAEPVVLVPEQNTGIDASLTQDPSLNADEPPLQQGTAPADQPVKKKKTLLGLFTGDNKGADGAAPGGIDAATEQQVASVNARQNTVEAPPPRAAAPAVAKSGFTLQLASFPTEQEARAEYQRVASRHAGKIGGLSPIISPVSVGGSTRYRLSLGTVSSSTQAQSICKDLASAGLRDCVVRRQQ